MNENQVNLIYLEAHSPNVTDVKEIYFQKYVPDYPSVPTPAPAVPRSLGYSRLAAPEKKMVKLAPLRMAASHTFDRSDITLHRASFK